MFPRQVNVQQAPGVTGDFATRNPRQSVPSTQGGFVAGPLGLTIGAFAWADAATNTVLTSYGNGAPTGFVANTLQGTFPQPGSDSGFAILPGFPATAFSSADFWVTNAGSNSVTVGMKAYANNSTGQVTFNATATPPTSASATGATLIKIVSAGTGGALPVANTCTGSISGTILTVTAVGAGSVVGVGAVLSGGTTLTGIVAANTVITSFVSGTRGGVGVYSINISQVVTSTAIAVSGGGLTLTGANTSGVFALGMTISGTNIPTGTMILDYGTATAGGAGTYWVSAPAVSAATASTVTATNAMLLTVDSSSTGVWAAYDTITGASVNAQQINATGATNANLTGLGGAGTYLTNGYQTAVSVGQVMGVNSGTETKWIATSAGAPGELVIMSAQALG